MLNGYWTTVDCMVEKLLMEVMWAIWSYDLYVDQTRQAEKWEMGCNCQVGVIFIRVKCLKVDISISLRVIQKRSIFQHFSNDGTLKNEKNQIIG